MKPWAHLADAAICLALVGLLAIGADLRLIIGGMLASEVMSNLLKALIAHLTVQGYGSK